MYYNKVTMFLYILNNSLYDTGMQDLPHTQQSHSYRLLQTRRQDLKRRLP